MKAKPAIIIAAGLLLLIVAGAYLSLPPRRVVAITGPLTPLEIDEIKQVVFRERAALLSGDFAPHRHVNGSAKDKSVMSWRKIRERMAGELRSIGTRDGVDVVVDFGDRWNPAIGYDYDLRRTTNGWRVVGVGYRGPP
ncbi:MAG: hypothetical protein ABMA26_14275 [Limisphaerales bacterium]